MKKLVIVIIAIIIIIFFIFGLDAFLINSTINKQDFSCETSADCIEEYASGSSRSCPAVRCLNNNWKSYEPIVTKVFALSCAAPMAYCTCEENQCVANYIPEYNENITEFIEDCNKIANSDMKNKCLDLAYRTRDFLNNLTS